MSEAFNLKPGTVGQFRKKPVAIEAIQWLGDNTAEVRKFVTGRYMEEVTPAGHALGGDPKHLLIYTLEGQMKANIGDWIIKGVQGEFYPCKPDIFEQTYELVD